MWRASKRAYGAKVVQKALRREGTALEGGQRGGVRRRRVCTTMPDDLAERPLDLAQRDFATILLNQLWVSDLAYVATWQGFVYVAFAIDLLSRRIVCWRVGTSLRCELSLDALEQALYG